jgi:hypothetical protein
MDQLVMQETIELGQVPFNEECAQTVDDNYTERARRECIVFKQQLLRLYQAGHKSDLPKGCRLRIKSNSHDFGAYYEVAVSFDPNSEAATEAAYWFENNCPSNWDDIAKRELL